MTEREKILEEAKQIICNDRNAQYGEPEDNFALIAELWTAYIGVELDSYDVGMLMVLFKLARLMSGKYKRDSLVDLIGYAACAAEGRKEND
jgi:hypothetical protein